MPPRVGPLGLVAGFHGFFGRLLGGEAGPLVVAAPLGITSRREIQFGLSVPVMRTAHEALLHAQARTPCAACADGGMVIWASQCASGGCSSPNPPMAPPTWPWARRSWAGGRRGPP